MNDLSAWSGGDLDALPFGYIGLSPEGVVRKYNRYEADLSGKDPSDVLGRNFFRDVAPCTQVQEFEGRFRDFASGRTDAPTLTFDFVFKFRHGHQKVRIGLVRSQLDREIILTVTRQKDTSLPTSAELSPDPLRGRLLDDAGRSVVTANVDFWRGLVSALRRGSSVAPTATLHEIGFDWGASHVKRIEALVQREYAASLRESELHVALEYLSSSLAALGLGRFDVELGYRSHGLLLVAHRHSPFAAYAEEGPGCAILAGLHAALMSHLAGRRLRGLEVACRSDDESPCRFVLATGSRLDRLLAPADGSSDQALLLSLGWAPNPEAVSA